MMDTRFVLLNYKKTLLKRGNLRDIKVSGNVFLEVSADFVAAFNVPTVDISLVPFFSCKFKNHQRAVGVKQINVSEYLRTHKKDNSNRHLVRVYEWNGIVNNQNSYKTDNYLLRFPKYFNLCLISQALFLMTERSPKLIHFKFENKGKIITDLQQFDSPYLFSRYGTLRLSTNIEPATNPAIAQWPSITIVGSCNPRKRKI